MIPYLIFKQQNPWRKDLQWRLKDEYVKRDIFDEIFNWIEKEEIIAIKGPRQVGKTTLLTQIIDSLLSKGAPAANIFLFSFENINILESFKQEREAILRFLLDEAGPEGKIFIFIDEFQYLKDGGKLLKLLFDIEPRLKFIITGSSSLELTSSTAKFLVGRLLSWHLHPFSFQEALRQKDGLLAKQLRNIEQEKERFWLTGKLDILRLEQETKLFLPDLISSFEEHILFGGYPRVALLEKSEEKQLRLLSIIETYLRRDIIETLHIRDLTSFQNVIKLLSLQAGNLVNFSEVARSSGTSRFKAQDFTHILQETMVVNLLLPYFKNKRTEVAKARKVYFLDSGLRNGILENFQSLSLRSDAGALVENAVFGELVKRFIKTEKLSFPIKFWRTQAQNEVDFVLEANGMILPIEVKYTRFQSPRLSRSFHSFLEKCAPAAGLILTYNFFAQKKTGSTWIYFIPACLI